MKRLRQYAYDLSRSSLSILLITLFFLFTSLDLLNQMTVKSFFILVKPAVAQTPETLSPQMREKSEIDLNELKRRLEQTIGDGKRVTAAQVTEAVLKLIIDDLKVFSLTEISPISIRAVVTRPPLSSSLSSWVELRLASLIHQESSLELRECFSCKRRQLSIDKTHLVFTHGDRFHTQKNEPKDDSNVQSYLELDLTWRSDQNIFIARARLYDQRDTLIWSENYRSGDEGALAKRGLGDVNEETSASAYASLASIPKNEFLSLSELILGYGMREGQIVGTPSLLRLGYGYGVFFGHSRRYALFFESLLSISLGQVFFDMNASLRYRLTGGQGVQRTKTPRVQSFYASRGLWVRGLIGIPFSGVVGGTLVGLGTHYMSAYKLGIGVSAHYSFNFGQSFDSELGGIGMDANLRYHF